MSSDYQKDQLKRNIQIENDLLDIKESQKRIEDVLMGTMKNGQTTVGLFEQVRNNGKEIVELQKNYSDVKELNKTVENLYRWKYLICGGFLVAVWIFDKALEGVYMFLKGLTTKG